MTPVFGVKTKKQHRTGTAPAHGTVAKTGAKPTRIEAAPYCITCAKLRALEELRRFP